jgi:hypothetical protein
MSCVAAGSPPVVSTLALKSLAKVVSNTLARFTLLQTYFDDARFFAANSASPMVSIMASWMPSNARIRCFSDSRAQSEVGSLGRGFSAGLLWCFCGMKSSFSAWSGLSIGAESMLHRSSGTTSIPSSMCLIRHLPECSLVLLSSLLVGNTVYMLGSGCMFLIDLRGNCMDAN